MRAKQRFTVSEYTNPRTGTTSFRVYGITRAGKLIRQNFEDEQEANQRCQELNLEYLSKTGVSDLRKTSLDPEQLKFAEAAFLKLEKAGDLVTAVDHWLRHGKPDCVKESPRLDVAFESYQKWMNGTNDLRQTTKSIREYEVGRFVANTGNVRCVDVTVDHVIKYLDGLANVSQDTKNSKRKVLSAFFSWCLDSKQRYMAQNPCLSLTIEGTTREDEKSPEIYSVPECERLLRAAEKFNGGELVPYIALCMFAGLRPWEAARLDWEAVNFTDNELKLSAKQAKCGGARTIELDEPLRSWLLAYRSEGQMAVSNHVKKLADVRKSIGLRSIHDGLRHVAISHFFRKTGSFGLTAERSGNSEAIIKKHYKAMVTSADTERFYALRPTAKTNEKIVAMPKAA